MQHEHLYRVAVEQVADYAIFMIDLEGRVASWNAGVKHVLGWDESEWLAQPFAVIFTPEDRQAGVPEKELERARQAGCAEDDRWHIRRDGTRFWASGITTTLQDGSGKHTGFLKVARDLTERKLAEVRHATQLAITGVLAEAPDLKVAVPKLLRAICAASDWRWGAVWSFDRHSDALRIVDVWGQPSNALSEFDEQSRQLALARGVGLPGSVWASGEPTWIADVSTASNFPRRDAAIRAGLRAALCFPITWQGRVLAVMEFFSEETRTPDPQFLGMMSIVGGQIGQFIDRKTTEDQLRASEARHAAGVDAALDCIISMDHRGRVTEWNPAAERVFGYQHDEALGRELAELIIPPSLQEPHRTGLARYLSTGEGPVVGSRFEITAVRKEGSEFPVELSITRLPSQGPPAFTGYLRDITEPKRVERELSDARRELEARVEQRTAELAEANDTLRLEREFLSAVLEHAVDGIVACDADGTLRLFNRATREFHGLPEQPLPPERWAEHYDLFQADGKTPMLTEQVPLFRALKEGAVRDVEMVIGAKGQPPRVLTASGRAITGADGRKLGAVVVMHDLTSRKLAEAQRERAIQEEAARREAEASAQRLRESEERYRQLVELSPDAVFVNAGGTVAFANGATARLFGAADPSEIVGRSVWELADPDARPVIEKRIEQMLSTGQPVPPITQRWRRLDGSWLPAEAVAAPVPWRGGTAVQVVLRDLSERQRAEAALRESEERLRLAVLIAQMGTFEIDLRTEAVSVNDAGREIYGWQPGEPLTFAKVQSHFHPEDRQEVLRQVGEAFRPDGPGEFEVEQRIIRPDGATRWIRVRGRAFFEGVAQERQATRSVGTYLDITSQKEAEAQREQLLVSERAARAEAERASRMKDEFLATLSHELRTPLNAILGWAAILKSGSGKLDPADLAQGIDTIDRNARVQTQIIEDLLDMSRIISGKFRLDVQRIVLEPIIRAVVDTVTPAAEAKGVRIQAVLDPLAGPVSGDPNRLQQVFWNLLTNAIKFTPRGGRVQVLLERVNSHLEISVIDTGEGVRPEFLPHVFDRFRQADASTTRRHGGLGLGLSIVRQLVELHGGSVRAKSAGTGQGSTFTVSLPLTVVHATSEQETERRHPQAGAATDVAAEMCVQLNGLKVLVVDDEPDARALLKRVLEDCQAVVTTAGSADEAMRQIAADGPNVLVSDIGMPGEDGYSLIRRIRALGGEQGGAIPAIALTAYARSEDRTRSMLAGFQMHVAKPVEPAELIAAVATLAGRTTLPKQ